MNTFEQQPSGLLGSSDAIRQLASKKTARLLVVSDSHGASFLLYEILSSFAVDCDALIFCGDGICDLAFCLEKTFTCIANENCNQRDKFLYNALPPVIAFARGNGDMSEFPLKVRGDSTFTTSLPKSLTVPSCVQFTVAGINCFITHGHHYSVDFGTETLSSVASSNNASFVFYGHTHRASFKNDGRQLILNPGSCYRPRGGTKPSFSVVTVKGAVSLCGVEYFQVEPSSSSSFSFIPYKFSARTETY